MYLHELHNEYRTARSWFLDEEIPLPVEVLNSRAEQVVNTIDHAYRRVLTGALTIYPMGTVEIDPTLIVGSAVAPKKADLTDEQMAPTIAVIGKGNAEKLASLAETAITKFRRAHDLLIQYGSDHSREPGDQRDSAESQFLYANHAFFKFAQQLVHILTEARRPTRRAELAEQADEEQHRMYGIKGVLDLYEAARRMYSMTSLGLPKTILDKLAERTVAALADQAVQATVDDWFNESFVDEENWPAFKSLTRTLIAAFWRYHLAIVTPPSHALTTAHDTFYDMLKTWEVHRGKQAKLTYQLAYLAEQKADEEFYFKLSTQEPEPEEDVETMPLSDELDGSDVLYRPAPASLLQISPKPEVRQ